MWYIYPTVDWTVISYVTVKDVTIYGSCAICPYVVYYSCRVVLKAGGSGDKWPKKEFSHHIDEVSCSLTMISFQEAYFEVSCYHCISILK